MAGIRPDLARSDTRASHLRGALALPGRLWRRLRRGSRPFGEPPPVGRRVAATWRPPRYTPPASPPDPAPTVSVIIPTRGSVGPAFGSRRVYVVEAVRSLLAQPSRCPLEIVVVYDDDTPADVLEQLREAAGQTPLVAVAFAGEFNFSAKCNAGVAASSGEVILLLNDDVEARSPHLVDTLVAPLYDPQAVIGATGPKLLFDDDTIQHAGLVYTAHGPRNALQSLPAAAPGPGGALQTTREVTALTGACLALTRQVYRQVGGLDEALPVAYNDVDLCLKIAATGRRLVWLADAVAYHFESRTRAGTATAAELSTLQARWGSGPHRDPLLPYERVRRHLLRP
ncbi:MAG: glycosyltransferase [Promicromonosporaceae bacterium]|nr:glycosyltransferase [Promicromonosporaceae bacterium]